MEISYTINYPFRLISKSNEKITNRYGRPFLSRKFRDWETLVKLHTGKRELLTGDLQIEVIAYFKTKVHSDAVNLFKGLTDALQGILYANDKQIKKASVEVIENSESDSFTVIVSEIT